LRHEAIAFQFGCEKKRAVRLTLNVDLYAKAKAVGIDVSQVAEAALTEALKERLFENLRVETAQDDSGTAIPPRAWHVSA
jgi:post-segregation antitoxin (ccd killing protein)